MSNPRIEEVSDSDSDDAAASDPEEMDVGAFDFARPQQGSLRTASAAAAAADDSDSDNDAAGSTMSPAAVEAMLASRPAPPAVPIGPGAPSAATPEQTKHYQCIYPVYFDAARSRAHGRRVAAKDAVSNPLARDIVDALSAVSRAFEVPLQIQLEPGKTHPKDWANPGRVRVLMKKDGKAVCRDIENSESRSGNLSFGE